MDKLEEVKKLKQLLDEGIISEEDFKQQKAKLLGLGSDIINAEKNEEIIEKDTRGKTKSLEDYEKELLEESNKEKDNKEEKKKQNEDIYEKEKLKIKAKLDAEEEIRTKRRTEQKLVVDKGVNKLKRILKWILATCLWIIGITSITSIMTLSNGFIDLIVGIIMLLLGCMACPKITDYTKKYETYTKHKTLFAWILVILSIILISTLPSEPENINNDTTNETNIIE